MFGEAPERGPHGRKVGIVLVGDDLRVGLAQASREILHEDSRELGAAAAYQIGTESVQATSAET